MSESDVESDGGCTICVVARSVATARELVQRLRALANPEDDPLPPGQETHIPWTIQNKYYTAQVAFRLKSFDDWTPADVQGVPAFVYVWNGPDNYRDDVKLLSGQVTAAVGCDPEVQLAVRLAHASGDETHEGADDFCSSHGFEYVDATGSGGSDPDADAYDDTEPIPSLPRVLDALSTIMWPSMVQAPATLARKSRGAHDLFTWGRSSSSADDIRAILGSTSTDAQRHEMEELERWLQEDLVHTPTAESVTPHHVDITAPPSGFDDDFGAFMASAPSQPGIAQGSLTTSPKQLDAALAFPSHDAGRSLAASASVLSLDSHYDFDAAANRSSASASASLAHSDAEEDEDDEEPSFSYTQIHDTSFDDHEDEDGLPTRAEIEATSRRIFGTGSTPPPANPFAPSSPSARRTSASANVPSAESPSKTTTFSTSVIPTWTPPARPDPSSPRERKIFRGVFGEDGEDGSIQRTESESSEAGAFDLNRVFSALQGMKEEIGMMDDEDERRRAAARVALGLVYGLEREGVRDAQEEI
ncbi:hypothetical protein PUNSTDRAFT_124399 [Punctularia strigosozonata HHB-11173 SS5]|uniref:uncharacterized protein n=1 Tax=Punctularia strigosozonata (strain HHB-11173) TaxID=741275 RepID=UPI0004417AA5|nr:uncharacterized protein PUNSTDRAFT_124399 [Punctularia strigosozonata HHB-11173 SS5]EIN12636.1 hypothetical protein PUNSTDRAFT_124399 [Punctularia strigosozonata HHB-11173 SS5]